MPLSAAGQNTALPAFTARNTVQYFEDFVGASPVSTSNFPPPESSGLNTNVFSIVDPADGIHISALRMNMGAAAGAITTSWAPTIQLNNYSVLTIEWEALFSGFDTSGGRNQTFFLGLTTSGNTACFPQNTIGFAASSAWATVCGAGPAAYVNNSILAYGRGTAAVGNGDIFGSQSLVGITGVWTKFGIVYTRATPSVEYYINDVLIGTNTDATRIPQTLSTLQAFTPACNFTVAAPTLTIDIDWISFLGTISR